MSKRKIHIWRHYDSPDHFYARCGNRVPESSGAATEFNNLEDATCLHCLRDLRDTSMRRVERDSKNVVLATEMLESLRRKKR